jgi:hypothetical protein|tara:strand:+ start:18669 stop:19070 length:402 start_codon:yes stop_codon:yes gene_type:complete
MKHYLLLFLTVISLFACNNDDGDNYHFSYVPVVSADVPDAFIYHETYTINVTYELPNGCHSLYNYDYIYDEDSRIIYPISIVNDEDACTEPLIQGEFSIDVHALQTEPYIFKFWQGKNEEGEDQFLIIEVPVT